MVINEFLQKVKRVQAWIVFRPSAPFYPLNQLMAETFSQDQWNTFNSMGCVSKSTKTIFPMTIRNIKHTWSFCATDSQLIEEAAAPLH